MPTPSTPSVEAPRPGGGGARRAGTWLAVATLLAAAPCLRATETERLYLSGRDKDDTVDWDFQCTRGAKSGEWTTLPVPSHWDLHGFGTLSYKKDLEEAHDERGLYRHDFELPGEWRDKRVMLVFEGVMTDTAAKVNGEPAGPVHQGGFYRFQYEVTPTLKFGTTNTLEVEVARHSANESVNKAERLADYWVFAGIYRPVYLEAVPQSFISRVAIDAKHDGSFAMDVFPDGAAPGDTLEARILGADGSTVGEPFSVPVGDGTPRLETRVDSPLAWTAETPHLHRVVVDLKRGGEVLHTITERFGFRTIEVRDGDGIYVNDRRVILKGVNRHSFWPDSGRCLSDEVHRLDIETIKDMNMNAVRMSHYPPDAEFLDLCDELGLYVLDELAGWHNHYDDEVGRKLVAEMVARDVNHPSILFWDNGNEGGSNPAFDPVFTALDPQKRRVLHPWKPHSGINTGHYLAYDTAKVALEGKPMYYQPEHNDEVLNPDLPDGWIYMPTEMLHGLYDGGGGASLEDYWKLMTASPRLGGGFIWVFCDEGVRRPDTGQLDTADNQAPDGMVGPYREREGSFYTIKQVWSPIQLRKESGFTFTVDNHYSFTNAQDCSFTWELRRENFPPLTRPDPAHTAPRASYTVESGELEVPSIAPGGTARIELELPESPGHRGIPHSVSIRVDDPSGRELWTWVWPLRGFSDALPPEQPGTAASFTEVDDAIRVTAGDLSLTFSKADGTLAEIRRAGVRFPLGHGPWPGSGEAELKELTATQNGSRVEIGARYQGSLVEVKWEIHPQGSLRCEYRYRAEGELEFHGVTFDLPAESLRSKRWLGNGPFRVWKNRLRGGTFGVWENDFNPTITGHSRWQYPEFSGCFSDVRWMELETTAGPITLQPGTEGLFVQVLAPQQAPDSLVGQTKTTLPTAGLGLLHAIPPIGSKFKKAIQCGPQSQLNVAEGEYRGSFLLRFGPPESP